MPPVQTAVAWTADEAERKPSYYATWGSIFPRYICQETTPEPAEA